VEECPDVFCSTPLRLFSVILFSGRDSSGPPYNQYTKLLFLEFYPQVLQMTRKKSNKFKCWPLNKEGEQGRNLLNAIRVQLKETVGLGNKN
jgi:hypothetical protein